MQRQQRCCACPQAVACYNEAPGLGRLSLPSFLSWLLLVRGLALTWLGGRGRCCAAKEGVVSQQLALLRCAVVW